MKAVIEPKTAAGVISAPPSKSYSHRALIAAGLAKGKSLLHGVLDSEDIGATIDCLQLLGVKVNPADADFRTDCLQIEGMSEKIEQMFESER